MKLKVYSCNVDGREVRLVAAKSMSRAAILSNIPYHRFREYGHETGNKIDCELALSMPEVVYKGKINDNVKVWSKV